MNILDKIVKHKRIQVEAMKTVLSVAYLQKSPMFSRKMVSLSESIKKGSGIIAEFKRRSPSRQVINQNSSVVDVVLGYERAGVSGISVLADTKYFGGALEDLMQARNITDLPILRKEFIIDAYQIYEAKAFGADAILLIASILNEQDIVNFSKLANELKMEVLLEIHNIKELEKSNLMHVNMVGINNRNLKTFEVNLKTSKDLSTLIPVDKVKISESGISSVESIHELQKFGYQGFLVGENFMKTDSPGEAAIDFLNKL